MAVRPLGACAECGGALYEAAINSGKVKVGLGHVAPACQRFRDMDCVDFLRWCNAVWSARNRADAGEVGDT